MQKRGHGRADLRPTTRSPTPSRTRPQTTRARLRGEFIRRAKERKRDYTVDWVHLKLNDQAQRTVLCKDPFKAHDERVEKLIASPRPLMDKLERLLNLTAALLDTDRPLTRRRAPRSHRRLPRGEDVASAAPSSATRTTSGRWGFRCSVEPVPGTDPPVDGYRIAPGRLLPAPSSASSPTSSPRCTWRPTSCASTAPTPAC